MGTILGIIALVAIATIAFFVWKQRQTVTSAADKFGTAAAAQLNKKANAAIDADPIAVMELENERDAAAIQATKPNMDKLRGQVNGLKRQIDAEKVEIAQLEQRLEAADSAAEAADLTDEQRAAFEAEADRIDSDLEARKTSHAATVIAYGELSKQLERAASEIKAANERIAQNAQKAQNLGRQMKASQTVKDARAVASQAAQINLSGVGGASRAEEAAKRLIEENFASADNADLYAAPGSAQSDVSKALDAKIAADNAAARRAARRANRAAAKTEDTNEVASV